MKLSELFKKHKPVKLNENMIEKQAFYCTTVSRFLDYAKTLGSIRFIYDMENKFFIVGSTQYFTHIALFLQAVRDGKYPNLIGANNEECEDCYIGLEGAEQTGAIVMKNVIDPLLKTRVQKFLEWEIDSTNFIYEFKDFYLCNGSMILNKLKQYTNEKPKLLI